MKYILQCTLYNYYLLAWVAVKVTIADQTAGPFGLKFVWTLMGRSTPGPSDSYIYRLRTKS